MTDHVAHYSVRWLSFKLSHPRERLRILAATADSRYRRIQQKDKNGKLRRQAAARQLVFASPSEDAV